jgi:hypothetical protein
MLVATYKITQLQNSENNSQHNRSVLGSFSKTWHREPTRANVIKLFVLQSSRRKGMWNMLYHQLLTLSVCSTFAFPLAAASSRRTSLQSPVLSSSNSCSISSTKYANHGLSGLEARGSNDTAWAEPDATQLIKDEMVPPCLDPVAFWNRTDIQISINIPVVCQKKKIIDSLVLRSWMWASEQHKLLCSMVMQF